MKPKKMVEKLWKAARIVEGVREAILDASVADDETADCDTIEAFVLGRRYEALDVASAAIRDTSGCIAADIEDAT